MAVPRVGRNCKIIVSRYVPAMAFMQLEIARGNLEDEYTQFE